MIKRFNAIESILFLSVYITTAIVFICLSGKIIGSLNRDFKKSISEENVLAPLVEEASPAENINESIADETFEEEVQ